ncbi:MAG: hypothetical protein ACXWAS_14030 [Methylobacter sp.]
MSNTLDLTTRGSIQILGQSKNEAAVTVQECGGTTHPAPGGGNIEAGTVVEAAKDSGAPPSNTAPANCITEDDYPIQVLRSGIDSLYLSYPGELSFTRSLELEVLKQQARSAIEREQAEAVYKLPGHIFEVHSKGSGLFSYILSDNAFRISLASLGAKRLPLAYVQIKSDWLVFRGVLDAVAELDVIIEQFGCFDDLQIQPNVSRADLFVDFVCPFPFDALPVAAWVSRAKRISTHTISRVFTGYSFGLGGDLSARLYDKTKELEESKKNYLKELWSHKGWDGEATVWRLEFQFKRPVLLEHGAGSVEELLSKLSALWRYSATAWLKLTVPSHTDSTQSRWPLHPVWEALANIDWGMPDQGSSVPVRASSLPSDRYLFINGLAGLTSFMAREGISDPEEAFEAFKNAARHFHDMESDYTGESFAGYLREKAAAKARHYNVDFPGVGESVNQKIRQVKADAYRKAKDGE